MPPVTGTVQSNGRVLPWFQHWQAVSSLFVCVLNCRLNIAPLTVTQQNAQHVRPSIYCC